MKKYYKALTIAGSDSGGGAGIQADLKTFSALGCFGMSVITAITAQNTTGVRAVQGVAPEIIRAQLEAVLEDIGTDAIKIGMLHLPEVIRAIASVLHEHPVSRVVLDPVMIAKGGARLIEDSAIQAMKTELFPLAMLITPNLPEASALLGREIGSLEQMETAAADLLALGPQGVLLKGGHLAAANSPDLLLLRGYEPVWLDAPRIDTRNTHGTGCTLSSAIAAGLAKGLSIPEAVGQAKQYLFEALVAGSQYQTGKGHGPVHHFHAFWGSAHSLQPEQPTSAH